MDSVKKLSDPERQPVPASMVDKRDIKRCGGCGIQDKRVEAGGVYYCPNPLCAASGAGWVRSQMGFHASEDRDGITPTDEWVNLRGWALRMVKAAKETPSTGDGREG